MSTTLDAIDNDRDQVRFQLMNGTIVPLELSLLYEYPESQLTQCALDVWNEDPEQIVYPLMDNVMFPLVVTFLRTKKVYLTQDCGITLEAFLDYLEKLGPWPESLDRSQIYSSKLGHRTPAWMQKWETAATPCEDTITNGVKETVSNSPCMENTTVVVEKIPLARKDDMKYKATEMFKFLSLDVTAYDVAREVLRRYLVDLNHTLIFTNRVQDYDTYMNLKRIKDGDMALGKACDVLLTRFGLQIQSLDIKMNPSAVAVCLCEATETTVEGDSKIQKSEKSCSILAFIKEDAPAVKLAGQSLRAFLKSDTNSCFYFDESQAHRVYAPRLLQKANQVLKRFGSIEIQSIERDGRIQVRLDEDYVKS